MNAATVTTWADGFGTWHASVRMDDAPFPCHTYAAAARRAIVAELKDREGPNYSTRSTRVELERVTGHQTVIYREVAR